MQVFFLKIVLMLASLLWHDNVTATSATEHVPAVVLGNVCRELALCANVSPVTFLMFGMPSAFMVLNLQETPEHVMRRIHDKASPFSQFTRVGNQVFYSGSVGQTSLQLVVDIVNPQTTHALLSATALPGGGAGTAANAALGALGLPGRRMLSLLPDGARLLMDICYPDHERTCHQVYTYEQLSTEQLASRLQKTLHAGQWKVRTTAAGLAIWSRHGRTLQYFMANVNGNTTLYVTAPAIVW